MKRARGYSEVTHDNYVDFMDTGHRYFQQRLYNVARNEYFHAYQFLNGIFNRDHGFSGCQDPHQYLLDYNRTLTRIAECFLFEGLTQPSRQYFHEAIQLQQQNNLYGGLYVTLISYVEALQTCRQYDKIPELIQTALQLWNEHEDDLVEQLIKMNFPQHTDKQLEQARWAFKKADLIAGKHASTEEEIRQAYMLAANAFTLIGDFDRVARCYRSAAHYTTDTTTKGNLLEAADNHESAYSVCDDQFYEPPNSPEYAAVQAAAAAAAAQNTTGTSSDDDDDDDSTVHNARFFQPALNSAPQAQGGAAGLARLPAAPGDQADNSANQSAKPAASDRASTATSSTTVANAQPGEASGPAPISSLLNP